MTDANRTLFERAQRVIPGGVNSPVRAFGSVGGTPYFVDRSDGPYVWDADGRRYQHRPHPDSVCDRPDDRLRNGTGAEGLARDDAYGCEEDR